ncbi:MAG: sugar phosphate isomerase/epimerase family protein [Gemmatimonas sp.]
MSDHSDAGLSRRSFLLDVSALTLGGSVLASCARTTTAGAGVSRVAPNAIKPSVDGIGVQLYTVGDQMRTDFEGTIEKVANIGYKQVEFAGYFNKTPEQVRALLDRLRIKSASTHIAMDTLRKDLDTQIRFAEVIGHEYITIPSLGRTPTPMNTVDAWKRIAEECNEMGAKLKARNIKLAFHSHSGEFVDVGGGRTGMDVFISETDPSVFNFQMDLGWARVAGQDPVAWFKKYPGRFVMWHVKDFENLKAAQDRETISLRNAASNAPRSPAAAPPTPGARPALPTPLPGRPSPVGSGDIDFRPIMAEWKVSGMRYFFVEQDGAAAWSGGSLGSIATSYQTLRKLVG